jgi:hypothetical protein
MAWETLTSTGLPTTRSEHGRATARGPARVLRSASSRHQPHGSMSLRLTPAAFSHLLLLDHAVPLPTRLGHSRAARAKENLESDKN